MTSRRDFLGGVASVAVAVALAMRPKNAFSKRGRGGFPSGFFPSSHTVPAKQPMILNYPRPDSETGGAAWHNRVYWDGINGVQKDIPVAVQFGRFPYIYSLTSPPGGVAFRASVWQQGWTCAEAIAAGYGIIRITPGSITAPTTLSGVVTDQDGNTLPFSFKINPESSTAYFVFVSPADNPSPGNDSTGTGSLTAPFETFARCFGAAPNTTTFPGAEIIIRAGTVPTYVQDSVNGIVFSSGHSPTFMTAYPGESVTVNAGNTTTGSPVISGSSAAFLASTSDLFVQGISFEGGNASATNWSMFGGGSSNRFMWDSVDFPNPWNGTNTTGNATSVFFSDPGFMRRQYVALRNVTASNCPNATGGQSYALLNIYSAQFVLVDLCDLPGMLSGYGITLKASTLDVTVRNTMVASGSSSGNYLVDFMNQYNEVTSDRQEICYCTLDASLSGGRSLGINEQPTAPSGTNNTGTIWVYRCNLIQAADVNTPTKLGAAVFEDNAIQWGTLGQAITINRATGALPSNVTNTGTECQAQSGVFNSDYSFTAGYNSYHGLRGATIA